MIIAAKKQKSYVCLLDSVQFLTKCLKIPKVEEILKKINFFVFQNISGITENCSTEGA